MTEKLGNFKLKQSNLDTCVFIGDKEICIVYVDDLLFWATDGKDIDCLAMQLHKEGIDLEQEHDAASFLIMSLDGNAYTSSLLEMKQD